MTTHSATPANRSTRTRAGLPLLRVVGVTWLVATAVVAVPAYMYTLVSDHAGDRPVGLALSLLAVAGLAVGAWLTASPSEGGRKASLVGSAAWLVAGVAIYPTQEFTADAVWAGGVPVVAAVVTALLAWRSRR